MNEEAIEAARKGFYSLRSIKGVSRERLRKYFIKMNDGYKIGDLIRLFCIFAHHNLLRDPPFNHLDIISCQNLLIYFTTAAQEPVFDLFRFALNPEGFLILGESESFPTYRHGFKKWRHGKSIYTLDH